MTGSERYSCEAVILRCWWCGAEEYDCRKLLEARYCIEEDDGCGLPTPSDHGGGELQAAGVVAAARSKIGERLPGPE